MADLDTYAVVLLDNRTRTINRLVKFTGVNDSAFISDIVDTAIYEMIANPVEASDLYPVLLRKASHIAAKQQYQRRKELHAAKVMAGVEPEPVNDTEKIKYPEQFLNSIAGTVQYQVAVRLNSGATMQAIAVEMRISPSTVGNIVRNLKRAHRRFKIVSAIYAECLELLTPRQQLAAVLHNAGCDLNTIAAKMNVSTQAVTKMLYFARIQIRKNKYHLLRLRRS